MDPLLAFCTALGLILVLELGDKTQLMTISFASRYSRRAVFVGVFCALSLVTMVGVAIGYVLHEVLPLTQVQAASALAFIVLGVWILVKREKEEEEEQKEIADRKVILQAFLLTALAELGDKTQLAVILMSAESGMPLVVLSGAILGFAVIVAVGVVIGREISRRVRRKWIVLASGVLFVAIGIFTILEAFL